MITNYVDISTKSLIIAGVVFLIVVALAKVILDRSNSDVKEEEKRSVYITMLYAVILGLIFALLSLVLCKQFCKFGTCEISNEPFPMRS